MKQWAIKKFKKNKVIRAIVHYPNKRSKAFWLIPKGEIVTIEGGSYRCNTEKDYFTLMDGIPTFTYQFNKVEPIRVDDQTPSIMNAQEYNTAINNKVVQDIFNASDKKLDMMMILVVGIVAMAVIMIIGFYFLNDKVQGLYSYIETILNPTEVVI